MVMYKMNLVKTIRVAERRGAKHLANMVLMVIVTLAILAGCGYYVYQQIDGMEREIVRERQALRRLEAEYRNYQETQSLIEKADIELLNSLLTNRVYWTRVLESMAKYLPDEDPISYWITKFGYREGSKEYAVEGFGYITDRQEQLLALDEYLGNLRADPEYSAVFGTTFLRSAVRSDEVGGDGKSAVYERVNFEYASMRKGAARSR